MALVVTIIVLLILAAVAINLTIGDNGIFTRAQEAVDLYMNSAKNEEEMMNSIDDIFKTKWEYTYAGVDGIISVDNNGDFYSYEGTNSELKGKNIEIVSNNVLYCSDTNKYYFWVHDPSGTYIFSGKEYIKAVGYNENELVAITKENKIVISTCDSRTQKINEECLNDKFPELNNIKWKDVKKIGNFIFIISDSNEYYVFNEKRIFPVSIPEISNIKIKNIYYNYFSNAFEILTNDGKILTDEGKTLQFEKQVNSIDTTGQIIKTTDGEYYVIINNEDGSCEVKSVKEINNELKNKVIVKAEDGTIITEDGYIYSVENGNIQNANNYFNELDGKKVIDGSMLEDISGIVTEAGELYVNTGNGLELLANNIKEIKFENAILKIINSQGDEGLLIEGILFFPNGTNRDIKMPVNLKGVKEIVRAGYMDYYVLLSDGKLYEIDITNNYKLTQLNDKFFSGRKIIFLSEYFIIDEEYNIYESNSDFENITNSYPDLKNNKVEQISYGFAIISNGELVALECSFSDEAKNEIKNKKFVKLQDSYVIDSEGNLYYLEIDYSNNMTNMERFNIIDIKIKDVQYGNYLSILSTEGKIYGPNNNNLECFSDNTMFPFYNKKIIKFSASNGRISAIDENGNKYDYVQGVQVPA